MIENQKNEKIKEILHKSPHNRWFRNGIHNLLSLRQRERWHHTYLTHITTL